ncbi:Fe-S cluster assembly sulfur transfer protein SufU [Oenococcus oeni]|uniref:Fe-S cluster assembly sulfur transfer protein SufU n=1 Tax=Oenococcus oeni TaxID=1247 RepID=UPI0010B52555|nr:SUF system NifU family Fe-S cluster assembly protein [Oenococcus oeni]SYW16704.1 SUF system NifU family Fe-S cluster assembly protein [Oenococcus oeni]
MGLEGLNQLYRQVILDAAVDQRYRGQLLNPTAVQLAHNPNCGDVLELQIKVSDRHITAIAFQGQGCTISQASASILADLALHQSLENMQTRISQFQKMITGKESVEIDQLGDASVFSKISQFPTRVKCAGLAWDALEQMLKNNQFD